MWSVLEKPESLAGNRLGAGAVAGAVVSSVNGSSTTLLFRGTWTASTSMVCAASVLPSDLKKPATTWTEKLPLASVCPLPIVCMVALSISWTVTGAA